MTYTYICLGRRHKTVRSYPIERAKTVIRCRCGKRANAVIGALGEGMFVRNRAMNEKSRKNYRYVFGRKKYGKIRTTGDVDRALEDFAKRYPHLAPGYKRGRTYEAGSAHDMKDLGHPDLTRGDPFPDTAITENRETHGE